MYDLSRGIPQLRCDMRNGCTGPVAYMDDKGFAYCAEDGLARQFHRRCRKLRPGELRKLHRGILLARY
jgi:hypothetical protein